MVTLVTVPEAAPQFRKTEPAMRWWLAQPTCPLKTAKIGGRMFVRQEDIDALLDRAFQAAS